MTAARRCRPVAVAAVILALVAACSSGGSSRGGLAHGSVAPPTVPALSTPPRVAATPTTSGPAPVCPKNAAAVRVVAGTGARGSSGDGGKATAARLFGPQGLAVDASGNLYIADTQNQRIRRVTPAGVITTVAGSGAKGFAGDGGPAVRAELASPVAVAADTAGGLVIADFTNNRVRHVSHNGVITTLAGTGDADASGDDGPAASAHVVAPTAVAVDRSGAVYVGEGTANVVRRIVAGRISAFAGDGDTGNGTEPSGPAASVALNEPDDVAVTSSGDVYIAEFFADRISLVDRAGEIDTKLNAETTVACAAPGTTTGGPGIRNVGAIAAGPDGALWIADRDQHAIYRYLGGALQRIAALRMLRTLSGLAVDGAGHVFVSDDQGNRVVEVTVSR